MLCQHRVQFVDDDAIPDGHDFILVAQQPCGALMLYRESAVTEETIEDSWAAYRAVRRHPPGDPTVVPRWQRSLRAVS